MTANPLLDFSGLPRFDAIRAEHVAPAVDTLLADARASGRARRHGSRSRPPGTTVVEPLADVARPARSRVGRRPAPQRRRQHAGAARRLQRQPAEGHRVPHRPRPGPAPVRPLSRAGRVARLRARSTPRRRRVVANELRDFRLGGAELPDDAQGALQGRAGRARQPVGAVRRQRARRDQRVGALRRRRSRARRRAGRRARRGARARPQPTGSPAGSSRCACPAICRSCSTPTTATLRATLHRALRHARLRAGRASGVGQHRGHRAHSGAAPGSGGAPGLSELRRAVAGAEDGATSADEVLAFLRELGAPREAVRRARLSPSSRPSRATSSGSPISRRGTSPTRRRS